MESLTCNKCGGKLKLKDNIFVCNECGNAYSFVDEENDNESPAVEVLNENISSIVSEGDLDATDENVVEDEKQITTKKKINWVGWFLGFSIVVLLIYAFVWMSGSDERTIKEVLADNGYPGLEIVAVEDLGDNIEGLDGNYKLVLIKRQSGELKYGFGAVNIEDRTFQDFEFGYTPLNVLMLKVFSSSEQMNIDNFNKAIEYVKKYGYYCLSNQDHAENYIREMTGENGFLPCEIGRKAIKDNITYILPNISSLPQSDVIFEDGNANPMYYAGLSSMMKYRWSHIFPESTYRVWEANVDTQQKNIMKAMYGQPYELQEVWAVVDKNLNEVGTYNSLSAVKEIFEKNKKKLKQADNTESKEKIENSKTTEDTDKNNDINTETDETVNKNSNAHKNNKVENDINLNQKTAENDSKENMDVEKKNLITDGIAVTEISDAKVGDHIQYGMYLQTQIDTTQKQPIIWRVLDKKENKILLLSEFALEQMPFHNEWEKITWEKCSLRNWLNTTFITSAFSSDERTKILKTEVIAQKFDHNNVDFGNNTQDDIFLLSAEEVEKYLPTDESRRCITAYKVTNSSLESYYNSWGWWLRTTSRDNHIAIDVDMLKRIYYNGTAVTAVMGIRPAMWIMVD